jgi:nucleoside diphosphate kinase
MPSYSVHLSLILFFLSRIATVAAVGSDGSCEASSAGGCDAPINSGLLFIKPDANTKTTQTLVHDALVERGIKILSETEIPGKEIDEKKLIDQHYYAIASKATFVSPKDLPVPADQFQETFGEPWDKVLSENRAANAKEACERFDCTADELNDAWRQAESAKKVVKFGGGFYCGELSVGGKPKLYVFNAFFMAMRSKFVEDGASIYCYEVEWLPTTLSWSSFRNELVGPTDPEQAPKGSIRRTILEK